MSDRGKGDTTEDDKTFSVSILNQYSFDCRRNSDKIFKKYECCG